MAGKELAQVSMAAVFAKTLCVQKAPYASQGLGYPASLENKPAQEQIKYVYHKMSATYQAVTTAIVTTTRVASHGVCLGHPNLSLIYLLPLLVGKLGGLAT